MGYYNYRTTGNAVTLPYMVNGRMYMATPFFSLMKPTAPPEYRHEHIRRYWLVNDASYYLEARADLLAPIRRTSRTMWHFYFSTPLGLAILAGLLNFRRWDVRAALAIAAGTMLAIALERSALPHYLAPAFGALLVIAGVGIQAIWRLKIGDRQPGPPLMVAFMGICLALGLIMIQVEIYGAHQPKPPVAERPQLIQKLQRLGGQHLVIVHYSPQHDIHDEWVYNRADIDASDVVWAQDMGTERNRELLAYYPGRKVWLLEPDRAPVEIAPYAGSVEGIR